MASAAPARPASDPTLSAVLKNAAAKALGGGIPGAAAMATQVASLMWLRTIMNFQYRYGTSTTEAMRRLYKDGGIGRFYKGVVPALVQGPLSRFGDTAANAGTFALLASTEATKDLPIAVKTLCASSMAGLWRIGLTPVDTVKTMMQVEGSRGLTSLGAKFRVGGPSIFFHGALANAVGTMVGHFPWFFTHNFLDEHLHKPDTLGLRLLRNAGIGFCSSFVSDVSANSIRVIKVCKQTNANTISYPTAIREVLAADGVAGLMFRGLKTRIFTNGLQSMLFTVLWKAFEDIYRKQIRSTAAS